MANGADDHGCGVLLQYVLLPSAALHVYVAATAVLAGCSHVSVLKFPERL